MTVVVALLVVALIAGIASEVVSQFGVAFEGTQGRHDQQQARLLAHAAVDWSRNVLAQDARTTAVDHDGETWSIQVPATPVEEGEIGGEIIDLSGRFNLNDLIRNGTANEAGVRCFIRLLQALGVPAEQALWHANVLVDWMDADARLRSPDSAEADWYAAQTPARSLPIGGPLVAFAELYRVRGFGPELLARLEPLVTVVPTGSRVNVNTAAPEVLMAMVPGLTLEQANGLVEARTRAWFKDVNDFAARLPSLEGPVDLSRLAVTSRYFLTTVRTRYGVSTVRMEALLDRQQHWSEVMWMRQR
jgi:general secretion pathway protein K